MFIKSLIYRTQINALKFAFCLLSADGEILFLLARLTLLTQACDIFNIVKPFFGFLNNSARVRITLPLGLAKVDFYDFTYSAALLYSILSTKQLFAF